MMERGFCELPAVSLADGCISTSGSGALSLEPALLHFQQADRGACPSELVFRQ